MPTPFQFTPAPVNPYAHSIADLMLRSADVQGAAAIAAANARARATELGGQGAATIAGILGQTAQGAFNLPAQIQQQRQAQAAQTMDLALKQQQLQAATRQNTEGDLKTAAQKRLGQAIASAAETTPEGMLHYNVGKFMDIVKGDPILATIAYEPADAMQRANDAYATFRSGQSKTKAEALQKIYSNALDAGGAPEDLHTVAAPFLQSGIVSPDDLTPTMNDLANAGSPEKARALLRGLAGVKPTYQNVGAGGSVVETTPGEAPRTVMTAPNPAAEETARHNKAMEDIGRMNAGREAAAQAETARHNRAVEAATNPLAALSGMGGGAAPSAVEPAPSGDAFLSKLPGAVSQQVKALAEGRMQFPTGFALKSPYWQSMLQMVSTYDPSFDAVNYNARAAARKDFTSGKAAQTINALNTVTQHLERLSDAVENLHNTSIPLVNTVTNAISRNVGRPTVTTFETDKKAVVDELTRAWRQAGGSEQDIKSWSSVLDAANSPAQLHGAIAEMGQLLEGKLSALENQYQQGMGTKAISVVTPEARKALTKLEQRASGGAAPLRQEVPGHPGTFAVSTDGGKTWKVE